MWPVSYKEEIIRKRDAEIAKQKAEAEAKRLEAEKLSLEREMMTAEDHPALSPEEIEEAQKKAEEEA